jgi:hypothetical protein
MKEQQRLLNKKLAEGTKKNAALMDLLQQQNEFMLDLEKRIQKIMKWGKNLKSDLERVRQERNVAKGPIY